MFLLRKFVTKTLTEERAKIQFIFMQLLTYLTSVKVEKMLRSSAFADGISFFVTSNYQQIQKVGENS